MEPNATEGMQSADISPELEVQISEVATGAPNESSVVLDGAEASAKGNQGKKKANRTRVHPIWDSGVPHENSTIGEYRKSVRLIQVVASNPWKKGAKLKTWISIADALLQHVAFAGLELSPRALEESVEKWVDNFKLEENRQRGKTGTDDEAHTDLVKLLQECHDLREAEKASEAKVATVKSEEATKKLADLSVATALLNKSAKGLTTKEAAKKVAKCEYSKLCDNLVVLEEEEDGSEGARAKVKKSSGGFQASLDSFIE
eukprot:gene31968-40374_t